MCVCVCVCVCVCPDPLSRATGSGMYKDNKGQRKLEDSDGRATSCNGRTRPRIEQNRITKVLSSFNLIVSLDKHSNKR